MGVWHPPGASRARLEHAGHFINHSSWWHNLGAGHSDVTRYAFEIARWLAGAKFHQMAVALSLRRCARVAVVSGRVITIQLTINESALVILSSRPGPNQLRTSRSSNGGGGGHLSCACGRNENSNNELDSEHDDDVGQQLS